ncbi:glycosyltransferase [Acidovorax sp. ACV02]|uniref:glycosyltransferase n=1 Tax=Acidovorax sp. ACV02 TaxID=2769310 RepID=UPI001782EFD8|nr:glycosyltransferase [Acidovorax sp. ACV02]MBD9406599.1 glycosyltransferase [Acidovorax sp. ACV02]
MKPESDESKNLLPTPARVNAIGEREGPPECPSCGEMAVMRQAITQLEQELITSRETVSSRDIAIDWLKKEAEAAKMTLEWRRKSLKYLLIDLMYLLADRSPIARTLGNLLLPRRLKRRLHAESLRNQFQEVPPLRPLAAPLVDEKCNDKIDIVCFANIEWSARYQRPQQMMSQFAAHGHRVFYIVRSGMPERRAPYELRQVAERIFEVCLAFSEYEDFYSVKMSATNLKVGNESFSRLALDAKIRAALIVVHLSYWTGLALDLQKSRSWRVQYDCMDEWADFPDIGEQLIKEEEVLVRSADLVTVTASVLKKKWMDQGIDCLLVRNAVDYDFFFDRCTENNLLSHLKKPIIGFYGALAPWIDFSLLYFLAEKRPSWNFVLVGDRFVKDLAGLDRMSNVHLTGRKPYEDMPRYLHGFDVCLIPFKLNKVTHAVDPVKFYEFMSAGKPVVSVPLEEMAIYQDYVYFATEFEDFLAKIEIALAEKDSVLVERRRELARENDWRHRYIATQEAIKGLYGKCSIVIVSFNNAELTRQCIESIVSWTTYPNYELIIVDNASSDGTGAMLQEIQSRYAMVKVLINKSNRGFAAANNQGIALAEGEYIVLLNNDTVVTGDWLEAMLRHLEDEKIGMVGPVTNSIGNEAKINTSYINLEQMHEFASGYTVAHAGRHFDISMLAMFCVAMRRHVFNEIGDLDEIFGLGMFEDDDYSRRMHAAGYRTVCAEDSFIHHYGQASFGKLIETGEYQAIWDRNQAYFESKWGAWKPHTHSRQPGRPE